MHANADRVKSKNFRAELSVPLLLGTILVAIEARGPRLGRRPKDGDKTMTTHPNRSTKAHGSHRYTTRRMVSAKVHRLTLSNAKYEYRGNYATKRDAERAIEGRVLRGDADLHEWLIYDRETGEESAC